MSRAFAMKLSFGALIFILLMGMPIILAAQDDPDIEIDWDTFSYDYYSRGDQALFINFGLIFPVLFIQDGSVNNDGFKIFGGAGSLVFNYYLGPKLYVGGEIGATFIPTVGENTLFIFPIGLRVGTQFNVQKFEFPIAATFGFSLRNFVGNGNLDIFFKGSGSVLYRATTQWAFGMTTCWYLLPEWTNNAVILGNLLDFTFTARYHF